MTTTTTNRTTRTDQRWGASQVLAAVLALAFLLLGILGAIEVGWDGFFEDTGEEVLGFSVNPFHNVVHLAWGAIGLALALTIRGALIYGAATAATYLVVFVYGLFAVGEDWDFLALNDADNWLHLVLAIIGAVVAAIAYSELRHRTTDVDGRVTASTAGARARR